MRTPSPTPCYIGHHTGTPPTRSCAPWITATRRMGGSRVQHDAVRRLSHHHDRPHDPPISPAWIVGPAMTITGGPPEAQINTECLGPESASTPDRALSRFANPTSSGDFFTRMDVFLRHLPLALSCSFSSRVSLEQNGWREGRAVQSHHGAADVPR